MADKKLIAFLVASLLFVVIVIGQSLLAEGVTNSVVSVKENEASNKETKNNNNRSPVEYTVTVAPSTNKVLNESGKVKPAEHYYKDGDKEGNQIDCGKATSFSDLVACESLNTQNSVDSSTVGIWRWTIISSIFSFFAFCAAAASVLLLRQSNQESRETNILQLKPYLEIGEPVASKFQGVGAEILFSIDIPIINTGPTPVTRAIIEISNFKLYVFIEGVRVTFLPTEHITSSEAYTKPTISDMSTPINPKGGMPYSQTIGSKFVRREPDAARLGDKYENEGVGFSFFATIRFKDISTTETDHRVLYFSVSKNTGSAELDGRGVTTPNEAVEADNGLFDKEY